MNLLPRKLTDDEITKCINDLSEFTYDAIEGGYVSNECAVILIDNRRPYIGQLLQYRRNVEKEILDSWVSKICDILKITQD